LAGSVHGVVVHANIKVFSGKLFLSGFFTLNFINN